MSLDNSIRKRVQTVSLEDNELSIMRNLFEEMHNESVSENQRNIFRIFKRCMDIVGSIILLILSGWIFPIIALLIKADSKGPIFFKQTRTGLNGADFNCFKFRTMKVNDEADRVQAKEGDTRITRIGNFLRNTHLDELPQFVNILIGDMSFVGPRPHMIYHTDLFSEMIPFYHLRHKTRPGLTGMAQVKGFVGEIQAERDIRKRVQWDIYYLNNQSVGMDLNIMLHTMKEFFQRLF